MDPSCLHHRLTDDERREFEETGLLVLPDLLSANEVASLIQVVDRVYARKLAAGHDPRSACFYPNFLDDDAQLLELVDDARVLPKVWGILGWNIYCYHTHLIVTPPCGEPPNDATVSSAAAALGADWPTLGWHQDSGRVNVEIESHPRPRLSLKVGYCLSDASEPGRGNFWVIPRSHLTDELEKPTDGIGQPAGAIPLLAKPGTAVFFDRRLWHSASPNWSNVTRKMLFYGYGYRWLRSKDDMTVSSLLPGASPIRRQLLGSGENANGFFTPTDADVPLRGWLREHSPEDAADHPWSDR
jgi:ectoine hydroxylase